MMENQMEELADLLADEETVLRGYIVVKGVKVMGHKFMGPDRTLSLSFAKNAESIDDENVLVCMVEKARGKAPLIYPVVSKPGDDD
ncbi:MAG: hypothetical protein V1816_11475 [Pseudomonadota bacterium]